MAHPGTEFVASVRFWASQSPANKKAVQDAFESAMAAVLEGQGGAIMNGSGNGIAFAQTGAMTNQDAVTVYRQVLESLASGRKPTDRTYGRIA